MEADESNEQDFSQALFSDISMSMVGVLLLIFVGLLACLNIATLERAFLERADHHKLIQAQKALEELDRQLSDRKEKLAELRGKGQKPEVESESPDRLTERVAAVESATQALAQPMEANARKDRYKTEIEAEITHIRTDIEQQADQMRNELNRYRNDKGRGIITFRGTEKSLAKSQIIMGTTHEAYLQLHELGELLKEFMRGDGIELKFQCPEALVKKLEELTRESGLHLRYYITINSRDYIPWTEPTNPDPESAPPI